MGLPGLNLDKARINVLAQGHNAVMPVRLEPAAPRSQVKHSTTALPQGFSDGKPPYVLAHTFGRTKNIIPFA